LCPSWLEICDRLTQSIQHRRSDQFFLDVALDTLREEFAQVGGTLARPEFVAKS